MRDLDARYTAALQELDAEWQDPEKQQIYTKPSAKLLNMRAMLKGMIKAKRFSDVERIGKEIEDQEQKEISEALSRMQHDYEVASQRLVELSEAERIGIEGKGETAMTSLTCAREKDVRPFRQRLDNLRRIREAALDNQKKIIWLERKEAAPPAPPPTRIPAFVHSSRLTVPPFAPKRTQISCTLPSQRRIFRPKTSATLTAIADR
jgi:hypothetical protein